MTEVKKTVDSNGVIHYGNSNDINATIMVENKTELDKSEVWDELVRGISDGFKKHGIEFDTSTISTKADLDNNARILNQLEQKEKAEASNNRNIDLHGGDTARWDSNQVNGKIQLDKNSDLPLEYISCENVNDLISVVESKAKSGDKPSQEFLSKITSKMIRSPKALDLTFEGSSKDFLRQEKKINLGDSEEVRQKKEEFNDNLRKNRTNWRHTFE